MNDVFYKSYQVLNIGLKAVAYVNVIGNLVWVGDDPVLVQCVPMSLMIKPGWFSLHFLLK